MGYFYILGCVFFTVVGQLLIKWRMMDGVILPDGLLNKGIYLTKVLATDIYLIAGFSAAFIASLFWMAAMTKFDISYAYPFMSLAFVLVMVGSVLFFQEPVNIFKLAGTATILIGIGILGKGYA